MLFKLLEKEAELIAMKEAAFFEGILTFIRHNGVKIENSGIYFKGEDGIKTLVVPAGVMRDVAMLMEIQYKKVEKCSTLTKV